MVDDLSTEMVKVRIKTINLEIEYEGNLSFLEKSLLGLAKDFGNLKIEDQIKNPIEIQHSQHSQNNLPQGALTLSTNDIAAELEVKKGPELVIASMAKLYFVDGKRTFSRDQILEEMKQASNYFEANHRKNLSNSLLRLSNHKRIKSPSKHIYSLSAEEIKKLEPVIVNAGGT